MIGIDVFDQLLRWYYVPDGQPHTLIVASADEDDVRQLVSRSGLAAEVFIETSSELRPGTAQVGDGPVFL